jgi:DNA invertase Pin-like site-specific DNA recombinase
MRTGAILLRVSSKGQAEEGKGSYEVQRQQCLEYARKNDIAVPDDLIWQEVGQRDQYYTRKGLQKALEAAEQNRYQALIVWRLDRLTDDIGNFLRILDRLKQHNALPWSATEPDVDLSTPNGLWYVHTKLHFQVQPERRTTATRTSENRRHYTEQGRPWASNRPRYGYKWVVDMSRTKRVGDVEVPLKERLEPDPLSAPVVTQLYEWVDEGKTLYWIARALSGEEEGGIHKKPTPRQHAKLAGANSQGQWTAEGIVDMLHFPGYMGRWPAYRTKRFKREDGSERHSQERLKEDGWVWVEPSPAPPLVDAALWQRVQTKLLNNKLYASRNTRQSRSPEDALLYRGMGRCAECGGRLDVQPIWSKDKSKPKRWRYCCKNALRNIKKCDGLGWQAPADEIDHSVWMAFLDVLQQPETLTRLARRQYDGDHSDDGVAVVTPLHEYAELQKKLAGKESDLQNLTLRSAEKAPDDPAVVGYDLAIAALGSEVAALRDECEQARRKAETYERVERLVGEWEEYLDMWQFCLRHYYRGTNFSAAARRSWLEALGARVNVNRREPGRPLATLKLHLTLLDRGGTVSDGDAGVSFPVLPVPLPKPRDAVGVPRVKFVEQGEGENRRRVPVLMTEEEAEALERGEIEKGSSSPATAASLASS